MLLLFDLSLEECKMECAKQAYKWWIIGKPWPLWILRWRIIIPNAINTHIITNKMTAIKKKNDPRRKKHFSRDKTFAKIPVSVWQRYTYTTLHYTVLARQKGVSTILEYRILGINAQVFSRAHPISPESVLGSLPHPATVNPGGQLRPRCLYT